MDTQTPILRAEGLQRFAALRSEAISAVTARFYQDHASLYAQFGAKGRQACAEDLGFHLEFLRPVLEFGLLSPMVDYLRWLAGVLATRDIPVEHLAQSLDWLADFFVDRMEPPDGQVVSGALHAAKSEFLEPNDVLPAIYAKLPAAWPTCETFEAALLAGDRRAAAAIIAHEMAQGRSLVEAELHVIQPAMYRIGLKWQNNQVSVAQEHLATAIAQSVMVEGLIRSEPGPRVAKKVLLACVEGNQHALGLQMVADAFELGGWEVNYLGANVPTASLVSHTSQWSPDLIGLSISFPHQLQAAKTAISRLQASLGDKRPPVIIGGLAINNFESLADRFGADGWSPDAAAAVIAADRLAGRGTEH